MTTCVQQEDIAVTVGHFQCALFVLVWTELADQLPPPSSEFEGNRVVSFPCGSAYFSSFVYR